MNSIVKLKDVSMKYHSLNGETDALVDINFSVNKGEFFSIVGPSGCGKSTLLSLIAGLIKPSSGEILLNDRPVSGMSEKVGYMLQKDHLFEWRNIVKNVLLGLEIRKNISQENKKYVLNLLDTYGLGEFKDKYPSQLSGGMRQRAALIRTLASKPEILLLDEAFSALDYQTRLSVADDIFKIIKKENKTAILVTHDIAESISLSDRVMVLSKRPGTVKSIHDIVLSTKEKSPLASRDAPEFKDYFNRIWKELDVHV
ncbi:ABC transporter ATP-binding protein [Herbivorax sp. ANBcel31]|uniref:ABC transporter ATP-binding protein n=1 Tax=Herbivorax sp. ANBcel31 TaxID=3069754 RepID=UPI0027B4F05C|nr:ABC transporter ATP-binding protein [Herbivorax sp. ANBcel31]MDQ2086105.1 ABC transporter ATP-binding protein [Herbivorax sp. ANBcel31]